MQHLLSNRLLKYIFEYLENNFELFHMVMNLSQYNMETVKMILIVHGPAHPTNAHSRSNALLSIRLSIRRVVLLLLLLLLVL